METVATRRPGMLLSAAQSLMLVHSKTLAHNKAGGTAVDQIGL